MNCDNCGKSNADDALFCAECGKALKNKPINLNLKQINMPASSRQARIVKVSASKKDDEEIAEKDVSVEVIENFENNDNLEELQVEETESLVSDDEEIQDVEEVQQPEEPEQGEFIKFGLDEEESENNKEETEEKGEFPIDADVEKMFRPMKKLDWFIVFILSAIPIVNIFMLFIWSFGIKVNRSKKTYAQMALILLAVFLGISIGISAILYFTIGPDFLNQMKQYAYGYLS